MLTFFHLIPAFRQWRILHSQTHTWTQLYWRQTESVSRPPEGQVEGAGSEEGGVGSAGGLRQACLQLLNGQRARNKKELQTGQSE
jgi:hypothetical protein